MAWELQRFLKEDASDHWVGVAPNSGEPERTLLIPAVYPAGYVKAARLVPRRVLKLPRRLLPEAGWGPAF